MLGNQAITQKVIHPLCIASLAYQPKLNNLCVVAFASYRSVLQRIAMMQKEVV